MATKIYGAELMLRDCCGRIDRGEDALIQSFDAEVLRLRDRCDAADRATRVLGGYFVIPWITRTALLSG